ncbi:MAG: vWA domain-containing protein [Bacteroidota bacterium]
MELIRFANIEYLYALPIVLVIILMFVLSRILNARALKKFGDTRLVQRLIPDSSRYKPYVKAAFYSLAMLLLIFAVANPQVGTKMEEVKREGVEVVIACDVSNSMLAEDIKPNRLEQSKQAIARLIERLKNDRIGLIAFAGEAFVQLPLTSDYSAAKLMTSTLSTDIIPTQGTAIGRALDLAKESFSEEKERQKVIILITDGENHEDDALALAKEADKKGIIIHTIGMGSEKGAPVPEYRGDTRVGFQKDERGETVVSKLNAGMLRQITNETGGEFLRASSVGTDFTPLIENIQALEKTEFEARMFTEYEDRFQYLLAAALLLLVLEIFVTERKNRFITSLNLFGSER